MSIKPATDTLRLLEGGAFLDKASEKLAELVRSVEETGKAGKLTITLDLKKAAGAIAIKSNVTAKVPEPKADETLLWATVEGNLTVQNPNQRSLDLQVVPGKGEVRNVDPETGEIQVAG